MTNRRFHMIVAGMAGLIAALSAPAVCVEAGPPSAITRGAGGARLLWLSQAGPVALGNRILYLREATTPPADAPGGGAGPAAMIEVVFPWAPTYDNGRPIYDSHGVSIRVRPGDRIPIGGRFYRVAGVGTGGESAPASAGGGQWVSLDLSDARPSTLRRDSQVVPLSAPGSGEIAWIGSVPLQVLGIESRTADSGRRWVAILESPYPDERTAGLPITLPAWHCEVAAGESTSDRIYRVVSILPPDPGTGRRGWVELASWEDEGVLVFRTGADFDTSEGAHAALQLHHARHGSAAVIVRPWPDAPQPADGKARTPQLFMAVKRGELLPLGDRLYQVVGVFDGTRSPFNALVPDSALGPDSLVLRKQPIRVPGAPLARGTVIVPLTLSGGRDEYAELRRQAVAVSEIHVDPERRVPVARAHVWTSSQAGDDGSVYSLYPDEAEWATEKSRERVVDVRAGDWLEVDGSPHRVRSIALPDPGRGVRGWIELELSPGRALTEARPPASVRLAAPALAKPDLAKLSLECVAGKARACRRLAAIAQGNDDWETCLEAVERLTDQSLLAGLARGARSPSVRAASVNRLRNQEDLAAIARGDTESLVRRTAAAALTDQTSLAAIARQDEDRRVRQAAASRLTNQAVLGEIARRDPDEGVREAAARRLTDQTVLAEVARKDDDSHVRGAATGRLADQSALAEVAGSDEDPYVRAVAVDRLRDQTLLARVVRRETEHWLRRRAVVRITDPEALAGVARHDADEGVRAEAAFKLRDQAVLADVARSDRDAAVRWRSLEQLTDQTALAQIAFSDADPRVRRRAFDGLHRQASLADVTRTTGDRPFRQRFLRRLWDMKSPLVAQVVASPDAPFSMLSVDGESLEAGGSGVVVFAGLHGLSLQGATHGPFGFVAGPREVCTVVCRHCPFPLVKMAGVECAERADAPTAPTVGEPKP